MHINAGDTAWMLTSTALVFFMMPGLALFYGGLVGAKNVIATMVQSFVAIGVISLLWVVIGYSLAFGADHWGRYRDVLTPLDGEWLLAHRRVTVDAAAPWSYLR